MRYVQRDKDGKVVAHFANEQSYATEQVPDNHPDILEWEKGRKSKPTMSAFEERLRLLEGKVK